MNIGQIEENLQKLLQNFSEEEFIYDLLLAYGLPKNTITLLKKGNRNLSKKDGQIILKKKLFFQAIANNDLHSTIDTLRKTEETFRHDPRFIIVTDYKTILAIDTKTEDTLDISIKEITKHFDFFLPWAGREKTQSKTENPADVKAAEHMARLYDEILKDNLFKQPEDLHSLNVFLSRLLFCFFAEDTDIFNKGLFTGSIASHTQDDGSDLDTYLNRLFEILNTEHRTNEPEYLTAFQYVNGGLFGHKYSAPKFSRKSRKTLLDCGSLDWSAINPDIFGSMIQAVVHPDQRGGMGMHYTSVPNIMKVIEPLFLNELKEEFEKYHDNKGKLEQLLARLERIRVFDPACGSGNFLIIAYKELRKLEIEIFQRINELSSTPQLPLSRIKLSQFYGIELDDFAHEVAILSLWLAEHQMNVKFKEIFGKTIPSLPLKEGGNITRGNAARLSWEEVCPKAEDTEIYILGNPPYLGSSLQDKGQKEDMAIVFDGIHGYKNLDYIACWFFKGANYITGCNAQFAFVSTNSICQGEQVALIWPHIFSAHLEIGFAHTGFKWTNNAKLNAGVTCVIIGIRNPSKKDKKLFSNDTVVSAENINPYLSPGNNLIIEKRSKPISKIPPMAYGSKAVDGGNLILSTEEKDSLLAIYPEACQFIKKFTGSNEFINGLDRWCLWITDASAVEALKIPDIKQRIDAVKKMRLESDKAATQESAEHPHAFGEIRYKAANSIIIPSVTSERRKYLPIGFLDADTVVSNSAHLVLNAEAHVFGLIVSNMHMVWVRATAGQLETRIRYSSAICYNNFPIPDLTNKQKENITQHVYNVLDEREAHSEKTIAELYDPDKMPTGLREAHHNLDIAVERCYRSRPFTSDDERLEYLFRLYQAMLSGENPQGELL
ncbi:MAG: class I SAM-dependent DNA methyltransferase [Pseudobdellovibrionaceae bacterium]